MTAGDTGTCRTTIGISQLDYLLAHESLTPLVGDICLLANVPWESHAGFRVSLRRKPSLISTKQFTKPKPLPVAIDSVGHPCLWQASESTFKDLFHNE